MSVDQLPDLGCEPFTLAWDLSEVNAGGDNEECFTVIAAGTREIWREPACWEGYDRFREIAEILSEKYSPVLRDLVPTEDSEMYLLGDSMSADAKVEAVRAWLRDGGVRGTSARAPSK